ncbi:hypothetical protein H9P43_000238 [Blastocladiella emersonii ATCC 22665]|nr:hypothetical protein H9P43_000238 [Blastocladiella emersonii ATCC 22665]
MDPDDATRAFASIVIKYTTLQRQGSIYHDKLLRGSPTNLSAQLSSTYPAAHTFMAKLHRAPLPSPTAFKVHLLASAVE